MQQFYNCNKWIVFRIFCISSTDCHKNGPQIILNIHSEQVKEYISLEISTRIKITLIVHLIGIFHLFSFHIRQTNLHGEQKGLHPFKQHALCGVSNVKNTFILGFRNSFHFKILGLHFHLFFMFVLLFNVVFPGMSKLNILKH